MGNKNYTENKESYIFSYTNGDKYVGEVKNGVREGYGTYYYHNGDKYEGMWVGNKKHGTGTLYYKDGNLYVGHWKNSEKEGIGCLYMKNGDKYHGEFKNGKKNGKGFFQSFDNNKYMGYFKDNKKNGPGIIEYKTGKKAKEEWMNGVLLKSEILSKNLDKDEELNGLENHNDLSFENFMEDQLKLTIANSNQRPKYGTLEIAKYFKARIPNNYFDAMQYVTLGSDLIYENPNVMDWEEDVVCAWLKRINLGKYEITFKENKINGLELIKLNIYDIHSRLQIKCVDDMKLLLKLIDFLRIFVKLKLDYQEYNECEKDNGEGETVIHLANREKNEDNIAKDFKTKDPMISNLATETNTISNHHGNNFIDRNSNEDESIKALKKDDSRNDELMLENQEYKLTKMSISNFYII